MSRIVTSVSLALASATAYAADTDVMAVDCQAVAKMPLPDGVVFTQVESISSADQIKIRLSEQQKASFKPYCRIEGEFERRQGAGNKPYAIGFGLNLPENWNGRLLFQGGGGLNGFVREPVGWIAAGNMPALFRGFAVASTDSGHQSDSVFNADFFADQQALLNFWSGAVSKTTVLVKQLVGDIYGQPSDHDYFVGCSTGGREALTMAQRFPDLFDGIIAGAPARVTNLSEIADLFAARTLRDTDENNQPPFSQAQQDYIVDGLLARCDALDGNEDGFIFDAEGCDFDPAELICQAGDDTDVCLSEAQAVAISKAFAGPKDHYGNNVYPGFFYDAGINDESAWGAPGLLHAQPGPLGRPRIDEPFDIDRELAIAKDFPLQPGNATLTNLSTFVGDDSKLMFFHGTSDPWFSAKDTLAYYQSVIAANGGEQADPWTQLYLVPGMGHCGGGERALDKFDMLSALVDWVEQAEKPADVEAFSERFPDETRPLCPYPTVTTYNGSGDKNDADSYHCAAK